MPMYRAVIDVQIYIEIEADTMELAEGHLEDASLNYLANDATAFVDSIDVLRLSQTFPEQERCDICNSRRRSDINGCAQCGNLNDRWRE